MTMVSYPVIPRARRDRRPARATLTVCAALGVAWTVSMWHALSGVACGPPDAPGMCMAPLFLIGYVPLLLVLTGVVLSVFTVGIVLGQTLALASLAIAAYTVTGSVMSMAGVLPGSHSIRLVGAFFAGLASGALAAWAVRAAAVPVAARAGVCLAVVAGALWLPRISIVRERPILTSLEAQERHLYLPRLDGLDTRFNDPSPKWPLLALEPSGGAGWGEIFVTADLLGAGDVCARQGWAHVAGCRPDSTGFTLVLGADGQTVVGELREPRG